MSRSQGNGSPRPLISIFWTRPIITIEVENIDWNWRISPLAVAANVVLMLTNLPGSWSRGQLCYSETCFICFWLVLAQESKCDRVAKLRRDVPLTQCNMQSCITTFCASFSLHLHYISSYIGIETCRWMRNSLPCKGCDRVASSTRTRPFRIQIPGTTVSVAFAKHDMWVSGHLFITAQ
jgi:hypothetical protein